MEAYREQYAELFNAGKNVVLLAISADGPEALLSWAQDGWFPFVFGSDPTSKAYAAFGGNPRDNGIVGSRAVIVVDPEGRIADVVPAFNQVDPMAYEHLGEVIDRVTPK
jgi:peroxiredoxin